MTNLELCCNRFNVQGGTIHQFSKMFGLDVDELLNFNHTALNTFINSYLEDSIPQKINELKKGQELMVCPDRIKGMMTAISYISITKDLFVTLHYVDNTIDTAQLTKDQLSNNTSFLSLVTIVQSN